MNQLHILHIVSYYPTPYAPLAGIFYRDQIMALRDASISQRILFPELRSLRSMSIAAIRESHFQISLTKDSGVDMLRLYSWNVPSFCRSGIYSIYAEFLFLYYINRFGNPDLIHAHDTIFAGLAAYKIFKKWNIPYVITEHSTTNFSILDRPRFNHFLINKIGSVYRHCKMIMPVSRSLAEALDGYGKNQHTKVVPNMVDSNFFSIPAQSRQPTPFRVIFAGVLLSRKRADLLINAFFMAFGENEEVFLEIVGDGPLKRSLEQLTAKLGLSGRVLFRGQLSREEIRNAMWKSNLLVLCSDLETFGLVVIEAMSTGIPVIATKCGVPENIITDNCGQLVACGDVDGLSRALRISYRDRYKALESEQQIRNYIVSNYGNERFVHNITGIYNEALI